MKNFKSCFLVSHNDILSDVKLPHNTKVIIGRGPLTKIKNTKCSKNQVEALANYNDGTVIIRQLGPNSSEVNGKKLQINEESILKDGDSLNLLKGDLKYAIKFQSAPCETSSQNGDANKRKLSEAFENDHESKEKAEMKLKAMRQNFAPIFMKQKLQTNSSGVTLPSLEQHDSSKLKGKWESVDNDKLLVYNKDGVKPSSKIAGFDVDFTIIATKSGKVFPMDINDWQLLYPEIPGKLKSLHDEGYKIVFFTNQRRISKGRVPISDFHQKMESILKKFSIPIQVFVSTGLGIYRKPRPGMWWYLTKSANNNVPIDISNSFYVGDAAGRPENWEPKKKKDFACSDRLFALNLGLPFYTPEEFFLNRKKAPFKLPEFDPRAVSSGPLARRIAPSPEELTEETIIGPKPEVIVCVGYPAAGKSHFVKTYLLPKGYVHVNRDKLGSWQKCAAQCDQALSCKRSVVIDNTNPDEESRQRYIKISQKYNVSCRCFLFNCSYNQARHQNVFRELAPSEPDHEPVNEMILNSYKSKYVPPSLSEGFREIVQINFVPIFKTADDEKLYKMFLIDK